VTFDVPWRPRIRAIATWGSGDRDPQDGTRGTFDGVFGGADIALYGYCNHFWANLWDKEVQLLLRPVDQLDLHIQGHAFSLASRRDARYSTSLAPVRRDQSGASGSDLGTEFDVRGVDRVGRRLELMAGIGYYRPGSSVQRTGAAPTALWRMAPATWTWWSRDRVGAHSSVD
jgi:hypothetical protein